MRLTISISAILAAKLLLAVSYFTLPITITGHLIKNPADTSAYINGIIVFVKADNKLLAKAVTKNKGDFTITFTPKKAKSFDFYCTGLGIDTLLISSVTVFENDTPEMTFYIPGIRKKNILGKIICPKCKKADKVYKIVYSDGIPDHFNNETKVRKQTANPNIIDCEYYAGTCIVDIAKYFCDRDNVKF